jgi:hypothetical protein
VLTESGYAAPPGKMKQGKTPVVRNQLYQVEGSAKEEFRRPEDGSSQKANLDSMEMIRLESFPGEGFNQEHTGHEYKGTIVAMLACHRPVMHPCQSPIFLTESIAYTADKVNQESRHGRRLSLAGLSPATAFRQERFACLVNGSIILHGWLDTSGYRNLNRRLLNFLHPCFDQ